MSHVTNIEADTADQQIDPAHMDCLRRAVEGRGGVLKDGQTTFRTWATDHGRFVGDYPIPQGFTAADVKSGAGCVHAIGLKAASKGGSGTAAYEIGLVPSKKHPGTLSMMYDFFGGALDGAFGKKLTGLMTDYRAEVIKKQALSLGDQVSMEKLADGTVLMEIDTTVRLGV